jgi:hypothetical protein
MEREEVFIYGGDNAFHPGSQRHNSYDSRHLGSGGPAKTFGLSNFPSVFVYSASFLLRNLFPAPPVRAPFHDFENVLERQSPFSGPFLSPRQAQTDALLGQVEEFALGSRTIGLLVGGTLALQAARGFTMTQEFQMTASALSNLPRARVAWVTLPALALVGCNGAGGNSDAWDYDAQGGAGGVDGASPVDFDGDGYRSNVDCDDMDRSVHPLPNNGGVVTLDSNTTVCPGIIKVEPGGRSGYLGIRITGTG